jgi:flagellar biosynthesis/type III secretory pathway M-ring protein FliF/YscJ
MVGRSREKSDKDGDGDSGDSGRSMSVLYDDWDVPDLEAKRKRESVAELIRSSPDRALAVVRRWMNSE